MRGRIAACSERMPRCEVAAVSPQSSESALAGRRGCVPRRQETGGRRRQNRQFCGCFISALTRNVDSNWKHLKTREFSPTVFAVGKCAVLSMGWRLAPGVDSNHELDRKPFCCLDLVSTNLSAAPWLERHSCSPKIRRVDHDGAPLVAGIPPARPEARRLLNRSRRHGTVHPPTVEWGAPPGIGGFQCQAFAFCKST
jgi:hypothetical protein